MNLKCVTALTLSVVAAFTSMILRAQSTVPAAPDNVPALSPPHKTIAYSSTKPAGTSVPMFSHGYLIEFKHNTLSPGEPNIYLWNSSGQLASETAIWPKGAVKLLLTSVDISAAGKLLFSGQAAMETGRPLFFIGGGDLDGTKQRYFSTGDYRASQVVAADDGSIWAIGAERATISTDDAGKRTTQWSNYDMLRHYTASGALQEHFLPRWEGNVAHWARTEDAAGNATWAAQDRDGLPTTTTLDQASSGVRDGWKTSRQVFLRSSGTVTVLYDAIQDRICKSDATANTFACKSVSDTATDMMSITGFALFPNGDILASMKSDGPNRNALRGLYRLAPRTDGSGVKWSPVSGSLNNSVAPDNFLYLLGTDGNSLVYRRQGDKLNVTTLYESVW